jgi:hypothetical protein
MDKRVIVDLGHGKRHVLPLDQTAELEVLFRARVPVGGSGRGGGRDGGGGGGRGGSDDRGGGGGITAATAAADQSEELSPSSEYRSPYPRVVAMASLTAALEALRADPEDMKIAHGDSIEVTVGSDEYRRLEELMASLRDVGLPEDGVVIEFRAVATAVNPEGGQTASSPGQGYVVRAQVSTAEYETDSSLGQSHTTAYGDDPATAYTSETDMGYTSTSMEEQAATYEESEAEAEA